MTAPHPAPRLLAAAALATVLAACAPSAKPPPTSTPTTPTPSAAASPAATPPPASSPTPALPPGPAPPPAAAAAAVYRGNAARRMVALTFDAGADAGFTARILDILRNEDIRATFSVAGAWAEANRDLLLAIAADGHRIINHTYDHASFTGYSTNTPPLTPEQRALELSRTETTVYHLAQRTTRPYWRPPYGDIDPGVLRDVAANGYTTVVMWTVDSLGWNHATADAIVERCLSKAEPGAIYVMHVGSKSADAAALPRVIEGLRAMGYTFGTIDNVLAP